MRKVYEDQDMTMLGYYQSLLDEAGIETMVKNEYAQQAAGEVPFTQVYPELWVMEDASYDKAVKLIRAVRDSQEPHQKVRYKDSQMMRSVVRVGVFILWIALALVVYSYLQERNTLLDSIQ